MRKSLEFEMPQGNEYGIVGLQKEIIFQSQT